MPYIPANKGKGKTAKWLFDRVSFQGDDCLIWPFSRKGPFGYGGLGYNGKGYYAHTFMCELVHGPKPTEKHQAAHTCGNGHLGCVNPRHLEWKTGRGNQLDRAVHGTKAAGGHRGPRRKLTPENVEVIRAMRGIKTQIALAAEFGVTHTTIRDIQTGKSWSSKPDRVFSDDEVVEMRRLSQFKKTAEIAALFKSNRSTIGRVINRKTYQHVL